MRQLSLLPKMQMNPARAFGHGKGMGKRKEKRPFSTKLPMHVVFRSSQAKGLKSLLTSKHKALIELLLERYSKLYRIKVYGFQNVGNHLHLILKTECRVYSVARDDLSKFLKRFSGEIAMKVSGAAKGNPLGRFWDELVYSRLVTWGREFDTLKLYLIKNLFEAHGLWNRKLFPDWELVTIQVLRE